MTISEEIPSVKTAIELEARRRKRVFTMFLALLIIPIAIGIYAIAKAPSETDVVVKNVTPIVERNVEENITARVDEKIEPRVAAIVERNATPVIQRTLDKQLDAAVMARVQPIEQRVRLFAIQGNPEQQRMAERLKELEARVEALERRLAALNDSKLRPQDDIKLRRPVVPVPVPQ